jgi:RimJ/RimL family protein N-acetyltransferase
MTRLPGLIEGEGILLRLWTPGDAQALDRAVRESIEHLRPWMAWIADEPLPLPRRVAMLERWDRDWRAGGDAYYGIFVGAQIAGACGLHRRRGPGVLEIGYWTHPSFLRQGIATTAAGLLTEAALAQPGIATVEIHHDKANLVSAGVPRRLGYRFVGETADGKQAPAELGVDCGWRKSTTSGRPA